MAGGWAVRRKQKMDENTAKTRSRRVATGGEKRAAKDEMCIRDRYKDW